MEFTIVTSRPRALWIYMKALAAGAFVALALSSIVALRAYGRVVAVTPAPRAIDALASDTPSTVTTAQGFPVGGLTRGAGAWTRFDELSPDFIRAILASEDARFFTHAGIDTAGVVRAAVANLRAGGAVQGGSTITQQLAKSFVGAERSYARKLRELVVARKLEARVSKSEILAAYANRAYFGAGAIGVAGAARVYFGAEASALTLPQAALLAAVLPAPGRTNPFDHPDEARRRRDRVLERVLALGLAPASDVRRAMAAPLGLLEHGAGRVDAPEVERAVWRELSLVAPDVDWRHGGRAVRADVDLVRQRHAQISARRHAMALDQRQGIRAPLGVVRPEFVSHGVSAELAAAWPSPRHDEGLRPVVILAVSSQAVRVWDGETTREVPRAGWAWAVPWRADATNHGESIDAPARAFAPGDIFLLDDELGLTQWPRIEVAVAAMDLSSAALEVVIGAADPWISEFDRATQGCRQPGSTFKPVLLSAALDHGYTVASLVRDGPVRFELGAFEEWRPRNADGRFEGPITLWEAAVWSRNLPILEIYGRLGATATVRRARTLGVTTPLDVVESLPLGASCVHPVDLLTVYSSFALAGEGRVPRLVSSVRGPVRVRPDAPFGLFDGPSARMDAWWRAADRPARQRIRPVTAWRTAWLLREVVRRGTARDLAEFPIEVAGKTGTTNAFDAWFAGFSPRDVTVVWVGADRNDRPLGRDETGGRLALPLWRELQLPSAGATGPVLGPMPPGLEMVAVEPESGLRAPAGRWGIDMPFEVGTAPDRVADSLSREHAVEADRRSTTF